MTKIGNFPKLVSPDNNIPSIYYLTIFVISPISAKEGFNYTLIDSKMYVETKT